MQSSLTSQRDEHYISMTYFLLTPFTHVTHFYPPPLGNISLFPISMSKLLFCFSVFAFLFCFVFRLWLQWDTVFFWCISLSIMSTRFIHVVENDEICILWLNNSPLYECVYMHYFLYPFIHWLLGCLHVLATVNYAAVNMQGSADIKPLFLFFWINTQEDNYSPKNGMVVLFFNFLRKLRIVFHSGFIDLHSYQQCTSSLFSTSSPTFVISFLL